MLRGRTTGDGARTEADVILEVAVLNVRAGQGAAFEAALQQKASVPVLRQSNGEADAVGRAGGAGALVDHSIDTAVRRKLHGGSRCAPSRRRGAGGDPFRLRDGKIHSRHLKLLQCSARRSVGSLRQSGSAKHKQNGGKFWDWCSAKGVFWR